MLDAQERDTQPANTPLQMQGSHLRRPLEQQAQES